MKIIKADNLSEYKKIESLAFEIIPEFYADVIPHEHNIFFVQKFQTVEAIQKQLENGFEYYTLNNNANTVGYFGIQIDKNKSEMILSKLYLLQNQRGLGYGTMAMDFIINRARELRIGKIILTVNRKNEQTINLYKKYGFSITKDLVNKFENGHEILDYEMTKIM